MAHLVRVFRPDDHPTLTKRQAPLMIEENLMMVMDLSKLDLLRENKPVGEKEMAEFKRKYYDLSYAQLLAAFKVDFKDVINILTESIPCVGCRRSVERLYYQLTTLGKFALDPLLVDNDCKLIIREKVLTSPNVLCCLLNEHSDRLSRLVDSQPRSKKSKRCLLHSWDLQKTRLVTPAWKEVWSVMHEKCKAEVTLIDFNMLLSKLENYLKKHRFCQDCRTKVMKAYNMLVEEGDTTKEKGYMPALYRGIRRCIPSKHIHLPSSTSYIDALIARAEPELMGNRRDRHAKTMEIAQEEVLTCIGMCIYDRIHRVFLRLREEEFTCRVLAAAGVEALVRSFETAVEEKRGITSLELLCREINKEEIAKRQRKEMKKLKKKRKKERRSDGGCECESDDLLDMPEGDEECECDYPKVKPPINGDRQKLQILDRKSKVGQVKCECEECMEKQQQSRDPDGEEDGDGNKMANDCLSCEDNRTVDCGYGSELNLPSSGANSSAEGSEVACSEGFCDHEGDCTNETRRVGEGRKWGLPGLSLEEMLLPDDEEEEDKSLIPQEEIRAFQERSRAVDVDAKRLELRALLKNRFAQMCIKAQTAQV